MKPCILSVSASWRSAHVFGRHLRLVQLGVDLVGVEVKRLAHPHPAVGNPHLRCPRRALPSPTPQGILREINRVTELVIKPDLALRHAVRTLLRSSSSLNTRPVVPLSSVPSKIAGAMAS